MPTSPPSIPASLLPAPNPNDRVTLSARLLEFVRWVRDDVFGGINAIGAASYTNAVEAATSAQIAIDAATGVAAPVWTAGTYVVGDGRFDPNTGHTYRCILAGASTVTPANDPTRWRLYADDLTDVEVTTSTHTAAHHTRCVIKTAGVCNITMPALVPGTRIGIKVSNGRRDNIVTFGASPHEDSTDATMKLNARFKSFELKATATKWEING